MQANSTVYINILERLLSGTASYTGNEKCRIEELVVVVVVY